MDIAHPNTVARRRRNDAGMTLLEVTIAAGIMAVALVCLLGSVMQIATTNNITEDRTVASAHVSTVLEELRSTDSTALPAYRAPALRGLGSSESIVVECGAGNGVWRALPMTAGSTLSGFPNPMEVRVTVNWQDRAGRPMTVRGSVLCAR